MPPVCIFCPAKATTKEHCIPKWMAKRVGLHGAFLDSVETTGRVIARKQPISFKSHRKLLLCEGCQNHFKLLEDRVIPLFEALESTASRSFSDDERMVLAQWGLKTAICLIFAERGLEDLVPKEDRYELREKGTLPTEAWIAFCAWDGTAGIAVNEYGSRLEGSDDPSPYAYSALLTTRRVGLKCVRLYGTSVSNTDLAFGGWRQAWPTQDVLFSWPPPFVFDDFDLLSAYLP